MKNHYKFSILFIVLALLKPLCVLAENPPRPKNTSLKSTSDLTAKKVDPELAQKAQEEFFDHHQHGVILTPLHIISNKFFSKLWKVWEEPARSQAANASTEEKPLHPRPCLKTSGTINYN